MNTDHYNSKRPAENLSLMEPVSAGLTLRTLLNKDSTYDVIMTLGENKALLYERRSDIQFSLYLEKPSPVPEPEISSPYESRESFIDSSSGV